MNILKSKNPDMTIELVPIHRTKIKEAAAVLSRAFHDDPPLVYSIPDELKRRSKSHFIFEAFIRYSISCGQVYATSDSLEGIAVWLPSDKVETGLWQDLNNGWLSIIINLGLETTLRQRKVGSVMGAAHKRSISSPHLYLFLLGVEPGLKRKGYAGKLLRPVLEKADSDGMACYLDNTKEQNLPVYRHFGFDVTEEYTIPGTSINLWAMIREPGRRVKNI